MQNMNGVRSLKICVSIIVIVMGVIAVVSIGFVQQKLHRVERMITSRKSDVDSDGNTEMTYINSWNRFDKVDVIPDSDERVSSVNKLKRIENDDRITILEDMVRTLRKEQEKWMKTVNNKSTQDKKPAQDMRAKRAVDDNHLDDRNKTNERNEDGDHIQTEIGSAIYIRWGRSLCPEETELVYDGVTAGSHYELQGIAANTLCLPKDPVWGKSAAADYTSNYSMIFGAEYRLWTAEHQVLLKFQNAEKLHQHNVPCALCRGQTRTSVFMLPGRNICYKGWHTEYHGYLMGGHYSYKSPSEYICVDEAPEADPAGYRDEGGKQLVPVEGVCGSLPCPPYVAGRELTCAVCSK